MSSRAGDAGNAKRLLQSSNAPLKQLLLARFNAL